MLLLFEMKFQFHKGTIKTIIRSIKSSLCQISIP